MMEIHDVATHIRSICLFIHANLWWGKEINNFIRFFFSSIYFMRFLTSFFFSHLILYAECNSLYRNSFARSVVHVVNFIISVLSPMSFFTLFLLLFQEPDTIQLFVVPIELATYSVLLLQLHFFTQLKINFFFVYKFSILLHIMSR